MKGKLPGNLDVLFRLLACTKTGYMMDAFSEMFKECNSTTVNLRVLWADKVWSVPLVPIIVDPCGSERDIQVPHDGLRTHQIHVQLRVQQVLAGAHTEGDDVGPETHLCGQYGPPPLTGDPPRRESFLGSGILNRDDEEWKTVRHRFPLGIRRGSCQF